MRTNQLLKQIGYVGVTGAALAFVGPRPLMADGWGETAGYDRPKPPQYGEWQPPQSLHGAYPGADIDVNTEAAELCPAVSGDHRTLYFVSARAGGLGGTDIWISRRDNVDQPWGKPENPGEPINSAANELCSTPIGAHGFLFVSNRAVPGACGGTDIYFTSRRGQGWTEPLHFGCDGINSPRDEMAPSIVEYFEPGSARPLAMELYFSSNRAGGFALEPVGALPDGDIYYARIGADALEPPQLVPGVNTANEDQRPSLRFDGLEMFFDSNRPGTLGGPLDVWSSTRSSIQEAWSPPRNDLGPELSTASGESRPFVSSDGARLYIASTRPGGRGSADIWVAVRDRQYEHGEPVR